MQGMAAEREAVRLLPSILEQLLGEQVSSRSLSEAKGDQGADFEIDAGGRRWLLQVKRSSSPGIIAAAADQLVSGPWPDGAVPVLVVPFMTPAGAKAAESRQLNWIDLSGNASLQDRGLLVRVHGQANRFPTRGRPASPFAPKSSRVTRALLLNPHRWWRQKELAEHCDLDPGHVSRVVHRLDDERLLHRDGHLLRPLDPDSLLDAWADDYRFDRHDIVTGHISGSGMELVRGLDAELERAKIDHAFTGLPAAWVFDRFAQFRIVSVYVGGDPRAAADALEVRRGDRGANVQIIGPNDRGVFDGQRSVDGLPCVAPVQVYLDLVHLPERAADAAEHLRRGEDLWHG